MRPSIPALLTAASFVGSAASAPLPEVASVVTAIVEGLPQCARPAMTSMLANASRYNCGEPNSSPDVACACANRAFKADAKHRIAEACASPSDIRAARKWAVTRCTDALASARRPEGVARYYGNYDNYGNYGSGFRSSSNVTSALPVPLFDVDEEEDETAAGAVVHPVAGFALALAMAAALLMI